MLRVERPHGFARWKPSRLRGNVVVHPRRALAAALILLVRVAAAENEDAATILARVSPAVVTVLTADSRGVERGFGSGFAVHPDGVVVTAWHVIAGASRVQIALQDGRSLDVEGILADDEQNDLALLKVSGRDLPTVPLGDSDGMRRGDRVLVLGSPMGLGQSASEGIVSAPVRVLPRIGEVLQVTAPISPGSSGGPVLNSRGEAVGVATAFLRGGQNLNFAIPINRVKPLLSSRSSVPRPLPPPSAPVAPAPPPVAKVIPNLSGTYRGRAEGMADSGRRFFGTTLTIVHRGGAISGTWWTSGQEFGQVTGSVLDTSKVMFRLERVSPCRGEFTGSAVMEREGAILRGSYQGVSCRGDQVSASFEVTREAP